MERLVCRNTVSNLLVKLIEDIKPERLATIAGLEQFPEPYILSNLIGERLGETYFGALSEISRELVPRHMGQSELNEALWALFREVAANSARYRLSGELRNRLEKFTQDVKRPLNLFEVAHSIGNLDLGGQVFCIGPVRFFTMDDNEASLWGLTEDILGAAYHRDHWMHHAAAAVQVLAVDGSRAFETSLPLVTTSMDLLRLAGVRDFISAFDDRLFLWRLSEESIIRQIKPNQRSIIYRRDYGFRPVGIEMGSHIKRGLDPELSSLQAVSDGELPDEINKHLERAINWISSSITRERLDNKIVDLCTALETMLLPNYTEGRKGQMIALRHRLIGGDWSPTSILNLYDLRSQIVHGNVLNVSHYLDYWSLLLVCFATLDRLVKLAKRNPEIQNLKDLVGIVENQDNLESVLILFSTCRDRKGQDLRSIAKQRLKDIRQIV